MAACALLLAMWLLLFGEDFGGKDHIATPDNAEERGTVQMIATPVLRGGAGPDKPKSKSPSEIEADAVSRSSNTKWTVQVSDGRDGSMVEGARVSLTKKTNGLISVGETSVSDASGRCELKARDDVAFLNVHCGSYLPWQMPIADLDATSVISVNLDIGRVLTGEVVKLGGEPMAGARVKVHVPANRIGSVAEDRQRVLFAGKRGAIAEATTDAHGRFRLSGLPFDEELVAWVSMRGWIPRLSAQQRVDPAQSEIRVEMLPTFEFRVQILDDRTGLPLRGLRPVVAFDFPPNCFGGAACPRSWPFPPAAEALHEDSVSWRRFYMFPDYQGDMPSAEQMTSKIFVRCIGFKDVTRTIQLKPGGVARETISLERSADAWIPVQFLAHFRDKSGFDGQLELEIWSRDASGSLPRLGARIVISFRGGKAREAVKLPPGTYRIVPRGYRHDISGYRTWWNPAGSAAYVRIGAMHGTVEVPLELAGAPVSLTVVDQHAQPVRGFDLKLLKNGSTRESGSMWDVFNLTERDAEESTKGPLLWLAPGTYRLSASLPGVGAGISDLKVTDSRELQRLTIRLK